MQRERNNKAQYRLRHRCTWGPSLQELSRPKIWLWTELEHCSSDALTRRAERFALFTVFNRKHFANCSFLTTQVRIVNNVETRTRSDGRNRHLHTDCRTLCWSSDVLPKGFFKRSLRLSTGFFLHHTTNYKRILGSRILLLQDDQMTHLVLFKSHKAAFLDPGCISGKYQ